MRDYIYLPPKQAYMNQLGSMWPIVLHGYISIGLIIFLAYYYGPLTVWNKSEYPIILMISKNIMTYILDVRAMLKSSYFSFCYSLLFGIINDIDMCADILITYPTNSIPAIIFIITQALYIIYKAYIIIFKYSQLCINSFEKFGSNLELYSKCKIFKIILFKMQIGFANT